MKSVAPSLLPVLLGTCSLLLTSLTARGDELAFTESRVEIHSESPAILALRDMDGDGDLDLVRIDARGFRVRTMNADGAFDEGFAAFLRWPGPHVGWELADVDGDGAVEVAFCVEGKRVVSHAFLSRKTGGHKFSKERLLLETPSYLPHGVARMGFVRDVDGDGRLDIIMPDSGEYRIHLALPEGGYADPIKVSFQASTLYRVGRPGSLNTSFKQTISVPWFRLKDIDGDGDLDLASQTNERVFFHLAEPELADEPTWVLELAQLRADLDTPDGIDFDDLMNMVQPVVWRMHDLDGEGPLDLVIQTGSELNVYLNGSRTGPRRTADQVMRSSGHVLYFFLRDVTGDGRDDLQLVRTDNISLGRVLRWLILPGRLDFDLYTYPNVGGSFSKRPARRNTLSLAIPRLLTFMDEAEGLGEEFERLNSIPAHTLGLDSDGLRNDVVDMRDGEFLIFRDAAPEADAEPQYLRPKSADDLDALIEAFVLSDFDDMKDGESKTLDIEDLDKWDISTGGRLRQHLGDKKADHRLAISAPTEEATLRITDLDGDGRSDLIVYGELEEGLTVVQFYVRK